MNYRDYKRMALANHADPATVEAGVLAIRSEMIDTLSRLEDRLSPRKLFDQIMQRGRSVGEGPSQFVSNLGDVVRDHPVSVVLLVGGAASLLNAEHRASHPRPARSVGEHPEGTLAERAQRGLSERAHGLSERAHDLGERAHGLGERAQDVRRRAHDAGERAQAKRVELQGRARERLQTAREQGRKSFDEARVRGERMIHEEPLLLAGIGLAIGAIVGARVRLSEREQRVLEAANRPEPLVEPQSDVVQRAAAAIERDEANTPPQREFAIEGEFESKIVEGAVPPDPNPGPPTTGGRNL